MVRGLKRNSDDIDFVIRVNKPSRLVGRVADGKIADVFAKTLLPRIQQSAQRIRLSCVGMKMFPLGVIPSCDDVPVGDQIEGFLAFPDECCRGT